MFKIINLTALKNEQPDVVKEFYNEREALLYINGLADAFSVSGYKVISLPMSMGINYDTPQYLIVKKYDDESENILLEENIFVLMSCNCKHIIVETWLEDDSWTDETHCEVSISNDTEENIVNKMKEENYILLPSCKQYKLYENEDCTVKIFVISL